MSMTRYTVNTDIEISPICLGTMTFGSPVSHDDSVRIVHWALDHGINFFDTADAYEGYTRSVGSEGGVAESILGEALHNCRDRVVITTKVGSDVGIGVSLAPDYIRGQIDASLLRMRTDYVDIYELHRPDPNTPLAETVAVMDELIKAGKIRCWGCSNYTAAQIQEMIHLCDAHHWSRPVFIQPPYSWLNRDIEAELLPVCSEYELVVTPYQPFAGGLLTGKYRRNRAIPSGSRAAESAWLAAPDDETYDRLEQFEAEAKAAGLSPLCYALRWALDQPVIASVVVGVKSVKQLEDMLAVFD